MFTLYDGRTQLYQWDLNRKIIVEDTKICEVHFCNRTSDCSLVVEPYYIDKLYVADIPNILLQDARPIRAYAYVDDQYTLTEEQFSVKSRTKPADYVYEETTTIVLNDILERAERAASDAETALTQANDALTKADEAVQVSTDAIERATEAVERAETAKTEIQEYVDQAAESANTATLQCTNAEHWSTKSYEYSELAERHRNDALGYRDETKTLKESVEDIVDTIPTRVEEEIQAGLGDYYTKEEVDTALENVSVDLTGYATEEYVDNALANVPTGDISITLEDDGEGNVTFVGGTLADGEEVQY